MASQSADICGDIANPSDAAGLQAVTAQEPLDHCCGLSGTARASWRYLGRVFEQPNDCWPLAYRIHHVAGSICAAPGRCLEERESSQPFKLLYLIPCATHLLERLPKPQFAFASLYGL